MSVVTVSASPALRNMDLTCINTIRTLSMDGVQAKRIARRHPNSGKARLSRILARVVPSANG